MDKVTNKDILEQSGLPSLLSTVFWSQKERAPSSPVPGYHQEKPEAERLKTDSWTSLSQQRDKWRALVK